MTHRDAQPASPEGTDSGWSNGTGLPDPDASPLRSLVARFPGGAAHVSGPHLWLNRHAEAIVGYRNEDLGTLDVWGRVVYGERDPEARAIYVQARRAGFPQPELLSITRGDGADRLIEFSAYLGDDEELWVVRDVTDAVRADQELLERQRRLDVAVTTAGLGIWQWDAASGCLLGDATTRRLFGLTGREGLDPLETYLDRVLDDDRPTLESALRSAVSGEAFDIEIRVGAAHGNRRWLRMHGVATHPAPDAGRIVGAVRDIDSYKRLDERLVHAARMESLGQLAGGVAHDFNNLLAVIQGQVEFVKQEASLSEKSIARIRSIERAVERGAGMVAALMQIGQPSAASADVIDVHETLEAAAESLHHIAGTDVTVSLQFDASRPHVRFAEARFTAMVLNLVTNARDAMPLGGHVAITTADAGGATDPAWSRLELTVEDTGIGMDDDTRERIFEPFFTTKAPGLGTGLGLASVYDSVLDADGTIEVGSTPGAGSIFTITLPTAEPMAADADDAPTAIGGRPGSAWRTVMLVEDDPAILEVTADVLRQAGYRVLEALGPQQALELAETSRPDLILTDIVMPGLSGPMLADRLRNRLPRLRVLFMSGYARDRHGAETVDPAYLIGKPFTHEELVAWVASVLAEPTASAPIEEAPPVP